MPSLLVLFPFVILLGVAFLILYLMRRHAGGFIAERREAEQRRDLEAAERKRRALLDEQPPGR